MVVRPGAMGGGGVKPAREDAPVVVQTTEGPAVAPSWLAQVLADAGLSEPVEVERGEK